MTRGKRCGRIVKLSAREWAARSLKIEQQERSTKHKKDACVQISSKELYILNKVKEAKIKIAREIIPSPKGLAVI